MTQCKVNLNADSPPTIGGINIQVYNNSSVHADRLTGILNMGLKHTIVPEDFFNPSEANIITEHEPLHTVGFPHRRPFMASVKYLISMNICPDNTYGGSKSLWNGNVFCFVSDDISIDHNLIYLGRDVIYGFATNIYPCNMPSVTYSKCPNPVV